MKIKKFGEVGVNLKYYAFDIDDNILHMPTKIHMEKYDGEKWVPTDVSTSKFAEIRNDSNWRLLNNDADEAFSEFRDVGKRGNKAFLEDMIIAIDNKQFGPSWDKFIECLCECSIFALITARGNEPETYRTAVEYIIDNVLSKDQQYEMFNNSLKYIYLFKEGEIGKRIPSSPLSKNKSISIYLDNCDYYGVTSNAFEKEFGKASASNPEKAKEMALDKFIEKSKRFGDSIGAKSVSVGFSDDDPKNVDHVRKYFSEKSSIGVKLNLYKTTDREVKGGIRTKFYENKIQKYSDYKYDIWVKPDKL